jgi:AraC family transcriptional regulator
LAKIALELEHALQRRKSDGESGRATSREIAQGDGWSVADVVCTSGPQDRPFEEAHSQYSIAVVLTGTFQYRSALGDALMTSGSLLLGNPGQCYECGHEHAEGDRCLSFWYAAELFERLTSDAGHRGRFRFAVPRIPAVRSLAPLVARAEASVVARHDVSWEELAIDTAGRAVLLSAGLTGEYRPPRNAEALVTHSVRAIDRRPDATLTLAEMSRDAGLSPYHFLRTFERLTGVTPHQYVLRARLREAARRLATRGVAIVDIALDCGFGDISNFNRSFRAEFGLSPRALRQRLNH